MMQYINDHLIDVPEDMGVVLENGFAGAHDRIVYKNFNIYTQDVEDYSGGAYAGKFLVEDGWGILRVADSLDEARTIIDMLIFHNDGAIG